ncbi:MAG TPA: flagellin [bacterium]|nr:flagellin [bacterium]
MIAVNTNVEFLVQQNFSRKNLLTFNEKVERLTNGVRVNRGADDPSGIAIIGGMNSQIRGTNTAITNAQDTINMLNLVDRYLSDQWDVMNGMKEKCVKLANEAVLNTSPGNGAMDLRVSACMELHKEIEIMKDHVYQSFSTYDALGNVYSSPRYNYNLKNLFSAETPVSGFPVGEVAQVGANNWDSHQLTIQIDDMVSYFSDFATPYSPPPPAGDATLNWYVTYAQKMMDICDDKMNKLTKVRVDVGTEIKQLNQTINDLYVESNWTSKSKSQIEDADMADEITALTKNQIVQQSSDIVATQANAMPEITLSLLGGIYDGINEKMVGETHIKQVLE